MTFKRIIVFILCLALPLAIGGISGYITAGQAERWFSVINKPSFNPPNWLFGPVWTLLYALMGVSLFLIWESPHLWARQKAMIVFFAQLFFNFWWSILFFSFHQVFAAVIDICVLWLLILYMIACFKQVKPVAAYLNVPYLLWVSFATILNIATWQLN